MPVGIEREPAQEMGNARLVTFGEMVRR